jgi:hypothetical protein
MNEVRGAFEFSNFTFFPTKQEDEYKIGTAALSVMESMRQCQFLVAPDA